MPLSSERRQQIHETTVRIDRETASRLSLIAQVLDVSINSLMTQAIKDTINFYEGDPDFQEQRKSYLKNLAGIGA
jgi:predicted transcriptional regulator